MLPYDLACIRSFMILSMINTSKVVFISSTSSSCSSLFPSELVIPVFVAALVGIEAALSILAVFLPIWIVFERVGAFALSYWFEGFVCPTALTGRESRELPWTSTSIMLLNCISEDNFECLSVTSDLNIDLNYLTNKIQKAEEAIRSNSRSTCSVIAFVLTMIQSAQRTLSDIMNIMSAIMTILLTCLLLLYHGM